jgi:hypothetical protein
MASQEEANVSESLTDIYKALGQFRDAFKERSENVQATIDLFLSIIKDDQSLHNFSNNALLRSKVKKETEGMLELFRTYDPNFIKKFEILQEECKLLAQLIKRANAEGAKIV